MAEIVLARDANQSMKLAAEDLCHRVRKPMTSPLWQCLDQHFDGFLVGYEQRFQPRYSADWLYGRTSGQSGVALGAVALALMS